MTEPFTDIYNPSRVKEDVKDLIAIIDPLLQEEIHRATQLLRDVEKAIEETPGFDRGDATMPAFYLFMHTIEIADGIRELLREVCTDAAAPLLRALFEAMLSLRFIVSNINKTEVAMAWYVNSLKSRRTALAGMDPITKSRMKKASKGLARPATRDEKMRSKEIRNELARLSERIDVDFKAIADKIKDRNWYTPYGGGANLEQLAANLHFKTEYTFYRLWSARIHAVDTDFLLGGSDGGRPILRGIRDARKLVDYGSLTSTMLLNCIVTTTEGYCPKIRKEIGDWYVNNAKARHDRLRKLEIEITTTAPIRKVALRRVRP